MSRKQETLWTAFTRQRKPSAKRQKTQGGGEVGLTHKRPVAEAVAVLALRGGDDGRFSEEDDADAGTVTDADLFSSQEDASAERKRVRCDGIADASLGTQLRAEIVGQPVERKLQQAACVVEEDSDGSLMGLPMALQEAMEMEVDGLLFPPHTATLRLNEKKEIMDSVHGLITFEPICMQIIDTLQFQRLRNLHQLGAANFVYIGATHSRFEHCLGVAYLAEKMVANIRSHQPWLPITDTDVLCIKIAGLCHDLGHGPFSHIYDGSFLKQLRQKNLVSASFKWTHEQGSIDMLDHLLASNNIDVTEHGLSAQDLVFIKELIIGGPLLGSDGCLRGRSCRNKRFLYDFVNNVHSGLDVDKLDYFMRDALHTGAKVSCDTDLLIRSARVLVDSNDSEKMALCFPEKHAGQVMQAFRTRFELHQSVYQHKGVHAIEYMICDILLAANSHLKIKGKRISEVMTSMEAYQHLDDRILLKIQESEEPELHEARTLLSRIYAKPYYNYIGKTALTEHSRGKTEDMVLNEMLRSSERRSLIDEKDGVILEFMQIHYGKGPKDPLEHVRFFSKNAVASARCFQLPVEAYEMFCPRYFQERAIRVFTRSPHLAAPVRAAFEYWSRTFNHSEVFPRRLH